MTLIIARQLSSRVVVSLGCAAVALSCAALAAKPDEASGKTTMNSAREFAFPRSVFVYRDRAGKDPFFPNRQRPEDSGSAGKSVEKVKLDTLTLRGITGNAERRVALINERSFAKGERGDVKVGTNTFTIRVVDIKEKSVTIEREGQAGTSELPLIDNLLPINKEK